MSNGAIFFDGWSGVVRTAVLAVLTYGALVLLIRVAGKRTLAKMNVFDFVFVIALGSALASTVLSSGTTLAEGVVGIGVLISVQYAFSWLAVRSSRLERLINGEPRLLVRRGELLREAMRRERVTEEEILAARVPPPRPGRLARHHLSRARPAARAPSPTPHRITTIV
jgi:uncharacterized membrane protein YcaP (DUF421 family)